MPSKKKTHPADAANLDRIARADHFNVHLRVSPTVKINETAATLREAVAIADRINEGRAGRRAIIYAITSEGPPATVPVEMQVAAREAASAATQEAPTEVEVRAVPRAPRGRQVQAEDAARRGEMPSPPDFSAPTHARYRGKLAQLVAMAEAKDAEALREFQINPISSSPKAMDRYRNLALMALAAQAG